jgi:hypothetical protein
MSKRIAKRDLAKYNEYLAEANTKGLTGTIAHIYAIKTLDNQKAMDKRLKSLSIK